MKNINLSGLGLVSLVREGVRLTFCLIGSQPASQLASCNWPANQPCDEISTCQALCWSDIWWQENRDPNHIGPQSSVQHSYWFPLGSDLPDQGQASDTNELCSILYTFGTTFRDHLQFYIYAASSHILAHTVEKCYTDYDISRPIYTYPSTINLMYHYSKVLLLWNYFYHQKSEMLGKKSEEGTSELRSSRPSLVPVLATRWLSQGVSQPDPKANQMSSFTVLYSTV